MTNPEKPDIYIGLIGTFTQLGFITSMMSIFFYLARLSDIMGFIALVIFTIFGALIGGFGMLARKGNRES